MLDGKLVSEPTAAQKEATISGFRERQRKLGETKIPRSHPVLQMAQRLLTRTLKRCDLQHISPGHGPGGVAEGYSRFERWDIRAWPSRAERWYPFHEYGSQSFRALCSQGAPVMVKDSITKCSLVPKDFKGPRLISSESTATQYLQQGQMKQLMRFVDNHWLIGRSVKFQDQTWNQQKCLNAYDNGDVTIDLSNASDTVSAALVWYLLSGVPKLRSQLFCTRSQYMIVEGERIRITAFSPMGSAVCFPVETLVFWALSMASVRFVQLQWRMSDCFNSNHGGSKDPMLPSEIEMASAIAVFGDDIIIPDYAMAVLIGTLTEVGCEVNTSKTCSQTPFRESCGSEYFNHTDIAIIRNRRYDYDVSKKFINNPLLLDLQRKFFLCGLFNSAALLRRWAEEILPTVTQIPWRIQIRRQTDGRVYLEIRDESLRLIQIQRGWTSRRNDSLMSGSRKDLGSCYTAVPSGLNRHWRENGTFDDLCCAFGFENTLNSGLRTRYNKALQRMECRLPCVFLRTWEWDQQQTVTSGGSPKSGGSAKSNRFVPGEARPIDLESGYPRLLARVVGDSVERIAIRTNLLVKMAWSELPYHLVSQLVIR